MSENQAPTAPATEGPAAVPGAAVAQSFGIPPEQIAKATEAAKSAKRFQDAADMLKKQASLATDPAERENLWRVAYAKEKEAHGESRKARIMASGWGQGAGAGIGISGAVGMGLGNLVGTLLSGVVAVPGSLIGAGVGALHGPWYTLQDMVTGKSSKTEADDGGDHGRVGKNKEAEPAGKGEGEGESEEDAHQEDEAHKAIVEAARKLEEEEEKKRESESKGQENEDGKTVTVGSTEG